MKKILCIAVCLMFVLSACKSKEKPRPQEKPVEPPVSKSEEQQPGTSISNEKCIKTIEKAAYIHLGDVVEDSYQGDMDYELDQEELKSLKKIKDNLQMEDTPSVSLYYYKLTIYDENKNILDTWTVDVNHRVEAGSGYGISEDSEIAGWLESVEKKYGITYGTVCDRAPGKNYLQMLNQAESISVKEITENNFVKGIRYHVTTQDIEALKAVKEEIIFGEEKEEFEEYYYQIHIYTESGAELYFWVVDFNGRIYDNGYEVKGDAVRNWLDIVEKKSGLTKKEKSNKSKGNSR